MAARPPAKFGDLVRFRPTLGRIGTWWMDRQFDELELTIPVPSNKHGLNKVKIPLSAISYIQKYDTAPHLFIVIRAFRDNIGIESEASCSEEQLFPYYDHSAKEIEKNCIVLVFPWDMHPTATQMMRELCSYLSVQIALDNSAKLRDEDRARYTEPAGSAGPSTPRNRGAPSPHQVASAGPADARAASSPSNDSGAAAGSGEEAAGNANNATWKFGFMSKEIRIAELMKGRAERAARRSAGAGGSAVGTSSDDEAGGGGGGGGGQAEPEGPPGEETLLLRRRLLEAERAAGAAREEAARRAGRPPRRQPPARATRGRPSGSGGSSHRRRARRRRRGRRRGRRGAAGGGRGRGGARLEAERSKVRRPFGIRFASLVGAGGRPLTASQTAALAGRVAELEGRLAGSGRLAEGLGALAAALVAARVAEATAALQRQADDARAAPPASVQSSSSRSRSASPAWSARLPSCCCPAAT
eukprot:tig00021489_g21687.t1